MAKKQLEDSFDIEGFTSHVPVHLLWIGIFIILASIITLGLTSWMLEYYDKIQGPIVLSTPTLPLELPSKANGHLELFAQNQQAVHAGEVLARIKSPTAWEDVQQIQGVLDKTERSNLEKAKQLANLQTDFHTIGAVQTALVDLKQKVETYDNFHATERYAAVVRSKRDRITLYRDRIKLLQEKGGLLEQDFQIANKQYKINEELVEKEVIAKRELETSEQQKLAKQFGTVNNKDEINAVKIQIKQLEQELLETESIFSSNKQELAQNIDQQLLVLQAALSAWEDQYLIRAERDGIFVLKNDLENGTFLAAGAPICTLLPLDTSTYVGRMLVPLNGTAKVQKGQIVNVFLANYPPNEFGILKGNVQAIANLPEQSILNIEVGFPNGLQSTYGIELRPSQLIEGQADILTERRSLMESISEIFKGRHLNQ